VVWRVRAEPAEADLVTAATTDLTASSAPWKAWVEKKFPPNRGRMAARAGDPGHTSATANGASAFRGGNRLYRVEVQIGGKAADATFKFSRTNGSVIFEILSASGGKVALGSLGRDSRLSLSRGDWVEWVSANPAGMAGPLFRVSQVDLGDMTVTLERHGVSPGEWPAMVAGKAAYLRRWDQKSRGGLELTDRGLPINPGVWQELEDNLFVQFEDDPTTEYQPGDYWLVPTRQATGDTLWPRDKNNVSVAREPAGVRYHRAPLAIVTFGAGGTVTDLRSTIDPKKLLVPAL
jgi:hypothetical protein